MRPAAFPTACSSSPTSCRCSVAAAPRKSPKPSCGCCRPRRATSPCLCWTFPEDDEMAIRYYWEDLQPGSVRELGSLTVTAEEIKQFARQFDPQPFHVDEAAGRRSIFGNLCASGWHTCALA